MKKKHLHGKLSLKIKDLSAMNGEAKLAMGGETEEGACTDTNTCLPDTKGCTTDNGPTCVSCGGFSCYQQCPDTTPPRGCNTNQTCYTTPDAGCNTEVSVCVGCIATRPPQAGC